MKNIAATVVLTCLSLCLAKSIVNISGDEQPTHVWGDVSGVDVDVIESKTVFKAAQPNTQHYYIFTYTKYGTEYEFNVVGVKHFDYADPPSNVSLAEDTLPQPKVHFLVNGKSGDGINSTFIFYGRYSSN